MSLSEWALQWAKYGSHSSFSSSSLSISQRSPLRWALHTYTHTHQSQPPTHPQHSHTHHVTWKELLHMPASQLMHTPVRLWPSSSHSWHSLLPHLPAATRSSVTPDNSVGSTYSIPGVYNPHTTCTHLWVCVWGGVGGWVGGVCVCVCVAYLPLTDCLNSPPTVGHNSQRYKINKQLV